MDIAKFRAAIGRGRIKWRRHVLERIAEGGLRRSQVIEALVSGGRIEDYIDDKPFPSALFLGYPGGRAIHAVASFDETSDYAVYYYCI
jgi:hypothetical protein